MKTKSKLVICYIIAACLMLAFAGVFYARILGRESAKAAADQYSTSLLGTPEETAKKQQEIDAETAAIERQIDALRKESASNN